MKFRNIQTEYPDYYKEYSALHFSIPVNNKRTEKEKNDFSEKWRAGLASIRDWLYAHPDETNNAEIDVGSEQLAIIHQHRKKLYDLWLEIRVQDLLCRNLKDVIKFSPSAIKSFCEEELNLIKELLGVGPLEPKARHFLHEKSLEYIPDFQATFSKVAAAGYHGTDDLHANRGVPEAEALLRYNGYLEKLVDEGYEEEPAPTPDPDEITLELRWPDLLRFANELTVGYRSRTHYYKEDSYVDYEVTNVSGCSVFSLRKLVDQMFEKGFSLLVRKLGSLSKNEQQNLIENLVDQIKELSSLISDGEYIEEESEHGPRREYRFRKFSSLRYKGDADLRFALNKDTRAFLDRKLVGYVEAWTEGIQAMERKLEHLLNNLSLVNRTSVDFDVKNIFDNVYILESEEIAMQGTAFYLQNIGIITCDHCLRDEDGKLCSDAVIYKHSKVGEKLPVNIVKSDKNYDLAILELASEKPSFWGTGLERGNSDELEQTDLIGVAGFPNYNYGDSGNFTTGAVSMFRTISGIRHILVTNPLVEGNSGGPGLNRKGQVVGVVTTGTSTFESTSTTEKHGLTPIEIVDQIRR